MKFWDSSALVPLIVQDAASSRMRTIASDDSAIATWWATPVECLSAFARLERERRLSAQTFAESVSRLRRAMTQWSSVMPTSELREHAMRMIRVHDVRSADALQLAAALVACDFEPTTIEFVTLDARLVLAADKEGFRVVTG